MATIHQIRGMLLEEVLLYLLRSTGYKTVEQPGNDPTLRSGRAGLEVMGRGSSHQIDAIADFRIPQPFSNPQRLLVEAKCYSPRYPTSLEIARNAVGVLKDVSEYWVVPHSGGTTLVNESAQQASGPRSRYHYQYALFSASGFTKDAQNYAYAQDIYLIPLEKSRFISDIIGAIRSFSYSDFGPPYSRSIKLDFHLFRMAIRSTLKHRESSGFMDLPEPVREKVRILLNLLDRVGGSFLAMLGNSFPVFLVPNRQIRIQEFSRDRYNVEIHWDQESWLFREESGLFEFSFNLPLDLFKLYAENGVLSRSRALDLKADNLKNTVLYLCTDNRFRVINLRLDTDWLRRLRIEEG